MLEDNVQYSGGYCQPAPQRYVVPDTKRQPLLLVVVDTEEGFDWHAPFGTSAPTVSATERIHLIQSIFEKYKVVPTYVIDYPVASQESACRYLRDLGNSGRCTIGSQVHPWVNPPIVEQLTPYNSFPGNLPAALEAAKLETLTAAITKNLGIRPTIYKAGRYGIGANTARILRDLAYTIDMSVYANREYISDGGPDFRAISPFPFWLDEMGGILEIPLTCGFEGLFHKYGPWLYSLISSKLGRANHFPGLTARLGLLNRSAISPEGIPLQEAKRLTRHLLGQGVQIFTLAFHSSSLEPGSSPYVRSEQEVQKLLQWIEEYLKFFMCDLGGVATTPTDFRDMALTPIGRLSTGNPESAPAKAQSLGELQVCDSAEPGFALKILQRSRRVRLDAKDRIQHFVGSRMAKRAPQNWPAWAANLLEIRVPATIPRKPAPDATGGANINVILALLDRVLDVPGDIAECGVFRGATLLGIGLHAEQKTRSKQVFGFDSFLGFDDAIAMDLAIPSSFDPDKRLGGFSNTTTRIVDDRIRALGLAHRIKLIPGYFRDTLTLQPARRYSFVHLDCDIYESYRICLEFFYPQMNSRGIILIDEYNDPPWPGCNRAVDEFVTKTKLTLQLIERDGYQKYFIEIP